MRQLVLLVACALMALVAVACSDDPKPPVMPTPVPCPVEAYICERAAEFADKLLVQQDFDWIVENYGPSSFVVCNEESISFPHFDPQLCEGAALNDEIGVYTLSTSDGGPNLLARDYAAALKEWVQSPVAGQWSWPRWRARESSWSVTACSKGSPRYTSKCPSPS